MATWLDDLKTQAGPDALLFFVANGPVLLALGADAAAQVVQMVVAGQKQAARVLLDSRLQTPADIIAAENQNAQEETAYTKTREAFICEVENFALNTIPAVLKLLAGVATGGAAL
jgi:hypothetical protein